jgi:hypothetical protein
VTDALPLKPDLGRFGVWISLVGPAMGQLSPELAVEIERLGYGAVWVGGHDEVLCPVGNRSTLP